MSFIHYLFVGDFDRDEHGVRFARPSVGEPYHPVVSRPISSEVVSDIVRDVTGGASETIPDDWSSWFADGYLIGDLYTKNQAEIEFISRLVERTGCSLYDRAAHSDISLSDWLSVAHGTAGQTG